MTLPYSQTATTFKTVSVAESTSPTVLSSPVGISEGTTTYRTVNLAGGQLQPVQYINSAVEGSMMYGGAMYGGAMYGGAVHGGARYLVPVQQRSAEQVVYMTQAPRYVQPVYVQNVQPLSISSVDTDVYRQVVSNILTDIITLFCIYILMCKLHCLTEGNKCYVILLQS